MEPTLTLLSSAIAALGHLLFALAARRSGHPVPRAFSRVALALSAWSGTLFLHALWKPRFGAQIEWIVALALVPLGLQLAAALRGVSPRLSRAARVSRWLAAAVALALALFGEPAVPIAAALLFPGLACVLVSLARAARGRGERVRPFLGAAAFALAAAIIDVFGLFERMPALPRLAGLGSLAIVALLGSAVARHGLFELKPLLGRVAVLSLAALVAALPLVLALESVSERAARVVVAWIALVGLALLQGPLVRSLRSPAARERERRRRALRAELEGLDLVLADATRRDELAAALRAALVDGGREITAIVLAPPGPRPAAAGEQLVLPLRIATQRLGWLVLGLREARLLEAPVLRRAVRRLAARIAVALRAIDAQEARHRDERLAQLGGMAAGIAHEIKNPLGAILGALDLMEGDAALQASPSGRWLQILREEARRLDRVVTDALALGKTPRLELAPASPRVIAEAALLLAGERARKFSVALTLDGGEAATMRLLDADQLRHALLNLVLNAISVQPSGGRVAVEQRDDGRTLSWHVRDDGPGIPLEQRARLFEPFFTTRPTGSGLGLAVAQRVALAHGGTLLLQKPDAGYRGAHFVLKLPVVAAPGGRGSDGATA